MLNSSSQIKNNIEKAPLSLRGIDSLPRVKGRIDHLAFNNKQNLLYIEALASNSMEVVDLKSKKVVHSLKGLKEPKGIRYITETTHHCGKYTVI